MIRRIRAHAARQDWFAIAVDFAIVVIGVYVGIQASNWNQDRQDRAEARQLRTQIVDNLKANQSDLAARTRYYRQVQTHAIAALDAIDRPGSKDGEAFLIDAYQASQVWLRPFERTAFDELQSSGLTRKIGDVRTRAAISSFSVTANGFETTGLGITSYREKLRRAMDLQTQNRIRSRCGDRMRSLSGGGEAPALPDSCRLDMPADQVARAVNRVKAIPELDQELTRLIVDIDQKQALFARMLGNARQLQTRLKTP